MAIRKYEFITGSGIVPVIPRASEVRREMTEVTTGQVSLKHVLPSAAILEYVIFQSRILSMQEVTLVSFPVNDPSPTRIAGEEEVCPFA